MGGDALKKMNKDHSDVENPKSFPAYTPKLAKAMTPTNEELNELFGRRFQPQPKQFTYRGKPVDKDKFFKAYSGWGMDGWDEPSGIRANDDEMVFSSEGDPFSLRFNSDGTLSALREDGEYDRFDTLEEMLSAYNGTGDSDEENEKNFIDNYYNADNSDITDGDKNSDWYQKFLKWRR